MEKRKKIFLGIGIAAFALISYFVYEHVMYVSTDNAQVEAHAVMIAPKVAGYIAEVAIVEGQKVNKGDLLFAIDDRDYQNTFRQVSSELKSIEARQKDAEKNFRRLDDLYSKGVISQQQHDSASALYADLKAKFEGVSAQVAQAQLNLENTKVRAPAAGFIAKKSVEVGQLASPGVPLLGFVDAGERWVTANFKETEVSAVKIGALVDITVDALSGHSYQGKVISISSATGATFSLLPPDNATGNFTKVVQRVPVRVIFEGVSEQDIESLKAGLSAFVKVHKY